MFYQKFRFLILFALVVLSAGCGYIFGPQTPQLKRANFTSTLAAGGDIGEPFGIAYRDGSIYFSDGLNDRISRVSPDGSVSIFASGLSTPSGIAFAPNGDLIVADTGSHTIKAVTAAGDVVTLAGADGQRGDAVGPAAEARFNGPIGVAVRPDGAIVVSDTYNDRIKIIKDGSVAVLAGTQRGFRDGTAAAFDLPLGLALWTDGRILVADAQNRRLRVIEPDGNVWTLAGGGPAYNGPLAESSFTMPTAVAVSSAGEIFIADADAVRSIRPLLFPIVETLTSTHRGYSAGPSFRSRFNRISGLAVIDGLELAAADSDNRAIRLLSPESKPSPVAKLELPDAAEFRGRQPGRWPYDPPASKRDIAGTLGEIRGALKDAESTVWFHNGLDIAGGYGETARFVRTEKVLRPAAVENFGTLRELIRLPELGYIHIRIGRDAAEKHFADQRFQFYPDATGVRIARGTRFAAGEPIGTLNPMNHVHLVAGPSGNEMNALDALHLPGVTDTIAPIIESIKLFDAAWQPFETVSSGERITVKGNVRIVVKAFDRMDGNPERRRLGIFKTGYSLLNSASQPLIETRWNINFDRNPESSAVKLAYAAGSHSGATGETIFNYVVTNVVNGNEYAEGFFETSGLEPGPYRLKVFAADFFGNAAEKEIAIEVIK